MKAKQIVCILVLFIFLMFKGTVALLNSANNTHSNVLNNLALEQSLSKTSNISYTMRTQRKALTSFEVNPNVENFNQLKNCPNILSYTKSEDEGVVIDEKIRTCNYNFDFKLYEFVYHFTKNLLLCLKKGDSNIIGIENFAYTRTNLNNFYCEWFFDLNEILKFCQEKPQLVRILIINLENFTLRIENYLRECKEKESSYNYKQLEIKEIKRILSAFKNGNYTKYRCIEPKKAENDDSLNKIEL